jgi:hypothetical protein
MKAFVSIAVLVASGAAYGGSNVDTILADKYFLKSGCINYLEGFSIDDQMTLSSSGRIVALDSAARYVTNRDTFITELRPKLEQAGIGFNEKLIQAKQNLAGYPNMLGAFNGSGFTKAKVDEGVKNWRAITEDKTASKERINSANRFVLCQSVEMAAGNGQYRDFIDEYVTFVTAHPSKSQVGYFEVATSGSTYGKSVGTGNRFAEPKQWEGSRFFVVNASFKNTDRESRLPVEGSLYITYNGTEYEFDSVETVMAEGYNIWFKKVNPLITMKTKIVYRIPDEIEGDVFWKPGRNPDDTRLWVGSVKAQQ